MVCTALLGGYEALLEQPVALQSDFEFVCFTDDPSLESETWRIRQVQPRFSLDLVRSVRHIKILLHSYVGDAIESLWIDNSVQLLAPPDDFLGDWLEDADTAAPLHSFRATLMDEFNVVAATPLDDPTRTYEQLVHYASTDPDCLEQQPYWGGMLARRHNERTHDLMQLWYEHVLRFSRRDQLSLPYVVRRASAVVLPLEIDNHESEHHRWPTATNRLPDPVRRGFKAAFVPTIAGLRAAEEQAREAQAAATAAAARVAELEEELEREIERNVALGAHVAAVEATLARRLSTRLGSVRAGASRAIRFSGRRSRRSH